MRILRTRKGFTTNSSGSSEWVPPSKDNTTESATAAPGQTYTFLSGPRSVQSSTEQPKAPSGFFTWSNPLFNVGFVGFLILCLFVVEEIVRKLLKKIKRAKHED